MNQQYLQTLEFQVETQIRKLSFKWHRLILMLYRPLTIMQEYFLIEAKHEQNI